MYKTTRIDCTTWGIYPIVYNNYKWNIAFKPCESPYGTPVAYNIVHQLYVNKKKLYFSEVRRVLLSNMYMTVSSILMQINDYFKRVYWLGWETRKDPAFGKRKFRLQTKLTSIVGTEWKH